MSTKLHHGYRLAEGVDLLDFQTRLRAVMNPVRDRIDASWLMHQAVHALDTADVAGELRSDRPLVDAMIAFDDAQHKESDKGHAQAEASRAFNPHRFEVAFGRDETTGRILALLYTDRAEFATAWEELAEVEEYGYWNNTDAPEHLSAAEWSARREAWARVLPDGDPPVMSMLTFALRSDHYDIGMMNLLYPRTDPAAETARLALLRAGAPTLEQRARSWALREVLSAWSARQPVRPDGTVVVSKIVELRRGDLSAVTDVAARALAPTDDVLGHILTPTEPTATVMPEPSATPATSPRRHSGGSTPP